MIKLAMFMLYVALDAIYVNKDWYGLSTKVHYCVKEWVIMLRWI